MSSRASIYLILLLFFLSSAVSADETIIRQVLSSNRRIGGGRAASWYCESWRFSVETNDYGKFSTVPAVCEEYVADYITGERYPADSQMVANTTLAYVNGLNLTGDGKDAWVFDIDETLLSNLPYYAVHHYGAEAFNVTSWDIWEESGNASALTASLKVYNELMSLGFELFLITGRSETYRNITEANLLSAGYKSWNKLILRNSSESSMTALIYKSGRRKELVEGGYRLRGSSGDQWSDLLRYPMAARSFKLPNPMYYIS